MLQTVVEEAARLCDAHSANIAVRDGAAYRMRAFTGFSPEFEGLVRGVAYVPDRESVVGRALLEDRVVHIEDVHADPELDLVQQFADQAAIALSLARLFETIERQRTELARYAPQAAELLSSPEGEQLLAGHRREITALFADLRGVTGPNRGG